MIFSEEPKLPEIKLFDIKAIFKFLWSLIYYQSSHYLINKITYGDTNYIRYWLYRKDYVLRCIPRLAVIDTFHNLGNWRDKLANWYLVYKSIEIKEYTSIKKP